MNSAPGPNDQTDFEQPEDRAVETVFAFVRTTILLAICAGLAFLGWTANIVNDGTNKMFEVTTTSAELAMPAEGPGDTPDWPEAFRVDSISMNTLVPIATVNGQRATEGQSVSAQSGDAKITARVVKITDGMVELKYRGERKTITPGGGK